VLDEDGPPRTRRQLMRTPVGALATGKVLSTLAVWTTNIAGAILVFDLTGSAFIVGLVSVAQFTPQLVLTPLTGARADRSDRFLQVIAGTAITALGSVLLTVWAVTAGFTGQRDAFVMVAAAGLVGTGFAVNGPATSALLPALVRRSELADALALNSLPIVVARSTGPAIGAALYLAFGPIVTFGLAGLLHVGFLVLLVQLRRRVLLAPRSRTGAAAATAASEPDSPTCAAPRAPSCRSSGSASSASGPIRSRRSPRRSRRRSACRASSARSRRRSVWARRSASSCSPASGSPSASCGSARSASR
jgi:hypothetical protein